MDQFFQEQSREGTRDSIGSFTLSPEKARQKLREYQLAQPESYVLKIVQAAVRSGALSLRVTVSRSHLRVSFASAHEDLNDPHRLLESLLTAHSLQDSALRHLVVGINAAATKGMREVRWETPKGSLVVTPDSVEVVPGRSERLCFVAKKERSLMQWFRGTVYLDETELIRKRCAYAKTQIWLDGRRLERCSIDRYHGFTDDDIGLPTRHYILEKLQPGDDDVWVSAPQVRHYRPATGGHQVIRDDVRESLRPDSTACPLLLGYRPNNHEKEFSVSAALAIRPTYEAPPILLLVKDGVLLEPREEPDLGHPGAVLLCSAEGLDLDLSEFSVVDNVSYRQRLQKLRAFARESTEKVLRAELETALRAAGLQGHLLEQTSTTLHHWLQHHSLPPARGLEDLLWQCFPRNALERAKEMSDDKLERVRQAHAAHLPKDEEILAIYDDTVLNNGTLGFVVTRNRLCWKGTLDRANYIEWHRLQTYGLTHEKGKIQLMGAEISLVLNTHLAPRLVKFLQRIISVNLPSPSTLSEEDDRIMNLAFSTLGKNRGVFYHPHIPRERLVGATKAYLPTGEDKVLVLYDDTMLGLGDNGFAITTESLSWMNLLSEPKQSFWGNLVWDEVTVTSSGVKLGEEGISIHRTELRELVAQFLNKMAASQRSL